MPVDWGQCMGVMWAEIADLRRHADVSLRGARFCGAAGCPGLVGVHRWAEGEREAAYTQIQKPEAAVRPILGAQSTGEGGASTNNAEVAEGRAGTSSGCGDQSLQWGDPPPPPRPPPNFPSVLCGQRTRRSRGISRGCEGNVGFCRSEVGWLGPCSREALRFWALAPKTANGPRANSSSTGNFCK